MNTRAVGSLSVLAFVLGIAAGAAAVRSNLFARLSSYAPAAQQGSPANASNLRELLHELIARPEGFVLTGTEDKQGRCSVVVTATALHDDYMTVKRASGGPEAFVPYAAIYAIEREGPGSVTIPVVHTSAYPVAKYCGD